MEKFLTFMLIWLGISSGLYWLMLNYTVVLALFIPASHFILFRSGYSVAVRRSGIRLVKEGARRVRRGKF